MIRCPSCQHKIELSGAKPGHYKPTCPACKQKFDLVVPKTPGEPMRVATLADAGATVPPATSAKLKQPVSETVPPKSVSTRPPPAVAGQPTQNRTSATIAPTPGSPDRTQFHTRSLGGEQLAYDDLNGPLAGYDILQKLGQGGMGSVYLARQQSLDRNVALKTLSPTLAMDPQFVARFTREAYAAAQLNHHHVVQIHDIGQDRGTNFYSMELVEGSNLAGIVEREGRLDPMTAVGYVLQAARGLKYAHERGLIHRDVKPDNLLLNHDGIVKVADLGLVKRAGVNDAPVTSNVKATSANATQLNTSMGTPAYMAPEQARDAAKVDHRADIYSLGCTLYDLITGRPPFAGKSALEVMTKHQREPITPPDKLVENLPKRLTEIIQKMTAKEPAERYQTMDDVVRDLEDFLGVEHGGGVRASQESIRVITTNVERFNASSFAGFRNKLILAFYATCAIAFAAGLITFSPRIAIGSILFAVVATLTYQFAVGVRQRTAIFVKTRQWLLGASIGDWLTSLAGVALAIGLSMLLGQLGTAIVVALIAAGAAVAFHLFVDHVVSVEREEPLREVEKLIREMRAKGTDEEGIRGFVAKFSGHRWEAFYEALFGYDAKIEARRLYGKGERGKDRKRHAVWRDWIIGWIERRIDERKQRRERDLLAKLEQKALEAKGTQPNVAARQARQTAAAVVERAASLKDRSRDAATLAPTVHGDRPATTYVRPAWLDAEGTQINDSLEDYQKTGYLRRRFGGPLDILFGRRVRFLLAAVLLLGSARWIQINGVTNMIDQARVVAAGQVQSVQDVSGKLTGSAVEIRNDAAAAQTDAETRPLTVPMVPAVITNAVGSWNGLVASVLLLLSVPLYGHLMSIAVIGGAALALIGTRLNIPPIGHPPAWMAAGAGAIVALLAMFFLRKSED